MTVLSWVALHDMAHSFIELHKPLHHEKAVINEGEIVKDRGVCRAAVHRVKKVGHRIETEEQQQSWARKGFLTRDRGAGGLWGLTACRESD